MSTVGRSIDGPGLFDAQGHAIGRAVAARGRGDIRIHEDRHDIIGISSAFWRGLVDHLPAGVFLLTRAGVVAYWNGWLAKHTGIPPEAAVGRTLEELYPGFDNPRFRSAVEQAFSGAATESPAQSMTGVLIPVEVKNAPNPELALMRQRVRVSLLPPPPSEGPPVAMVTIIDVTDSRARSLSLLAQVQSLRDKSSRDPLTGIYNYGFMSDWLDQQIKLAMRHAERFACMMIDIDRFKIVNDEHGHPAGNMVLQALVSIICSHVRASDVVARYGGDEFIVLLPACDLRGAALRARAIIEGAGATAVGPLCSGALTCSIGLSTFAPETPCTARELLQQADKQLYEAKTSGGNALRPNIEV